MVSLLLFASLDRHQFVMSAISKTLDELSEFLSSDTRCDVKQIAIKTVSGK